MACEKIEDVDKICEKNSTYLDGLNLNDECETPSSPQYHNETVSSSQNPKNLEDNLMEVKEVPNKLTEMKRLCEDMLEISGYLLSENASKMDTDLEEVQGNLTEMKKLCENIVKVLSNSMTENAFNLMESSEVRDTLMKINKLCENMVKLSSDSVRKFVSELTQKMPFEDVLMKTEKISEICETLLLNSSLDPMEWKQLCKDMMKQSNLPTLHTFEYRQLTGILRQLTVKDLCERIATVSAVLLTENTFDDSVETKPSV